VLYCLLDFVIDHPVLKRQRIAPAEPVIAALTQHFLAALRPD